MKRKPYTGYRSYDYLEPGVDYRPFRLARDVGRVEPYVVAVTPEQEREVQEILEGEMVISLHDHTFVTPDDATEIFEYNRQGRHWTGYEGLSISGLDVVFENFMDGTAIVTSSMGWKWTDIVHDLGMRLSDLAHQEMVIKAETLEDLFRARRQGQIALVCSLEAATPIENEVDRLDVLYGLGVRCLGIAYSEANTLGSGLREPRDGGLTVFGRQCVRRMNRLGISIDVSHSGDQTALDTIEVSEKPVFITHSGARSLWNTNRMKPDEVLKACAERGGVIGIEAAPHTTISPSHRRHSIDSFMEHFEHVVNLCGIDHVAFGPDTMFGDHVGVHRAFAAALSLSAAHGSQEFEQVEYVEGVENPAEVFPNVTRWLVAHDYGREDIARVLGGNVLRVLRETWYR